MELQTSLLIVEDDPAVRHLMELALTAAGHKVCSTGAPLDALDLLQSRQPDLVVLDLAMPQMDGETFWEQARARGYRGRVIVVSGSDAARESASRLGTQFIRKPFDPQNLCGAVDWSLRQAFDPATRSVVIPFCSR